jgi:hypothetical protein
MLTIFNNYLLEAYNISNVTETQFLFWIKTRKQSMEFNP